MRRLYEEQGSEARVATGRKGLQEEDDELVDSGGGTFQPASAIRRHEITQTEATADCSTIGSFQSRMDESVPDDNDVGIHQSPQPDVEQADDGGAQSAAAHSPINLNIQVDPGGARGASVNGDDMDFSVDDNATLISEITDTHVVEAFTRAEMADRLRRQLRSQMHQDLRANVVTAEVIDETNPAFWTKRRLIVSISFVLIVAVGVVVGVVIATRATVEEEFLDGVTLNGTSGDDLFGERVVISRDASTLASAAEEGHYLQVFRQDQENLGPRWNLFGQTLHFEFEINYKFQGRLALNKDGRVLAVGRWNDYDAGTDAGYAIVYWNNGSVWTQLGESLLGRAPKDNFGYSVALSDDGRTVGVGSRLGTPTSNLTDAGYVRVFAFNSTFGQSTGQWVQLGSDLEGQTAKDQFGMSLALSQDGRRIAVGAKGGDEKRGSIRVFDYSDDGDWTQVGEPIEGDYENDEADIVTMSANGSILVVASSGDEGKPSFEGYRRTFRLVGCCTWRKLGDDLVGTSTRIALSSDGTCLAVGIPDYQNEQGRGELYRWNDFDSKWNPVAATKGDNYADRLGTSVTVSGNCSLFALGATRKNSPGNPFGYVRVYQVP